MNNTAQENLLNALGKIILEVSDSISFTILEIGALPLDEQDESFHILLDIFPGSKVFAFEVDNKLCEEMNKKAKQGLRFFPVALGRTEETRQFYETEHPMCCSLYQPNEELLKLYNNMEVAYLKSVTSIDTVSLDYFVENNGIDNVDFIKVDIQGAELDVFQGGINTLSDVGMIVSEVEFIPHYVDQPLFGDVSKFLTEQNFMLYKFLGLCGRSLRPIVMGNDPYYPSQHIWTDALFIKNILRLSELSSDKLLKMGVLSVVYGIPDLAYYCFGLVDAKKQTNICQKMLELT